MIFCSKCGRDLGTPGEDRCVASISGGIMGDEYVESYFFCDACNVYTVEIYHDRFLGEGEVRARGPLEKGEGEAKIALIRNCETPWDKKCRCPAHMEYFNGQLD